MGRFQAVVVLGLGVALSLALFGPASAEEAAGEIAVVRIPTPRGVALAATRHTPAKPSGTVMVLAPGQGYHRERPLIRTAAEALASAGITALRFDWAYFTAKGQPSEDLRLEREDLEAAIAYARALPGVTRVLLAGKSLGSIVALARAAAKGDDLGGLALLTFPLGVRPGAERLADLRLPTLVVNGDRDPLADLADLYALAAKSPAKPRLAIVPGDHGFETAKGDDAQNAENVALAVQSLVLWARRLNP